ncbi:MAG: hypothetical protein ACHQ1D_00115 [Nitrososphaerales archaeon]
MENNNGRVRDPQNESWVGKKVLPKSFEGLMWLVPTTMEFIVTADLGEKVQVNNITSNDILKYELNILP